MNRNERAHYFNSDPWSKTAAGEIEKMRQAKAEREELVRFTKEDAEAMGLAANDEDWLLLTNRLASHQLSVVKKDHILLIRPDFQARQAVFAQLEDSRQYFRPSAIGAASGIDAQRIVASLKAMTDPTLPASMSLGGDHRWEGEDLLVFEGQARPQAPSFRIGGPSHYPLTPLMGLYERHHGGATAGGAAGRVSKHILKSPTTWGSATPPLPSS